MIIGIVLLSLVAVLLFFGVAERVFKSFGVAYWLAFIMVGALIGCAFIPSFNIGRLRINAAGFIAPTMFAVIFFVLARRTREVWRAIVAMTAVAALYLATLMAKPLINDTVIVVIAGFLCGAVAYLTARTKLASLAAVFAGFPLGELLSMSVSLIMGENIALGSAVAFDACVLAAVFAVVLYEAIAAIKRNMAARARLAAEVAEEFDPDEYKRYFDE